MVLLISETDDDSTNWVIDWLFYFQADFIRINRDDLLENPSENAAMQFSLDKDFLKFNLRTGQCISVDNIKATWFRRSIYPFLSQDFFKTIDSENFFWDVSMSFYYEYQVSTLFLYSNLGKNGKKLGHPKRYRLNKLEVLNLAKKNNIDIPCSIITNNKEDLRQFLTKNSTVITKPIAEIFGINNDKSNEKEIYLNYTEEITEDVFNSIPERFFYSLFQEKLKKEIELRVFYLDNVFYSMAIFSQLDEQTSVDFRKYSNNRNVPFQLPITIENNLRNLMKDLNLNCGSIDLVKTIDGRYVFLEVNPNGQYGMTSFPCNYHLHKKIAEYLTNYD